jgi:rubrerythrin
LSASKKAIRRIADEEQRHSDMLDKTNRLREQRLARDTAEAEAAKGKTKRKRGGASK